MFAMMLKQKNWQVTVIEKSKITGGGVRTFWHGGHPFTFGPRHFIGPENSMPAFEFLNKIIPMRHLKKMNYSYQAKDDFFAHYPIHIEDIKKLSDSEKIFKELDALPEESKASNFEDFWSISIGSPTLKPVLADLSEETIVEIQNKVRTNLPADEEGRITYSSFANAIKGIV